MRLPVKTHCLNPTHLCRSAHLRAVKDAPSSNYKARAVIEDIQISSKALSTSFLKRSRLHQLQRYRSAEGCDPNTFPSEDEILGFIRLCIQLCLPSRNADQLIHVQSITNILNDIPSLVSHQHNVTVSKGTALKAQLIINESVFNGPLTHSQNHSKKWLQFHTLARLNSSFLEVAKEFSVWSLDDIFRMLLTTSLLQSTHERLGDTIAEPDDKETRGFRFNDTEIYLPFATSIEHRGSAAELSEHLQTRV